ncbi:MAG: hypothetical protein HY556_07125 [Euryarchaeota archaeon]|nr:hypothetical protein [Euryarchaeota archaeon]
MDLGAASLIFVASYLLMTVPRWPRIGVRVDRHLVAIVGGLAMVASGVLTPAMAVAAVDVDVLVLLFGMMALVAGLEVAGFFHVVAARLASKATSQEALLMYTCFVTAALSALVLNDAVALLLTPVLITACRRMGVAAMPYLAAEVISANVGSVATEVGNPQNAFIAARSGISFFDFSLRLVPVAVVCLVIAFLMLRWAFRRDLAAKPRPAGTTDHGSNPPVDRRLLAFAVGTAALTVLGFLASPWLRLPLHLVALAGGSVIVLGIAAFRGSPLRVLRQVDYHVLVFFVGLFLIIQGASVGGLLDAIGPYLALPGGFASYGLALWSAILSNVVSNVPAVILLVPSAAAEGTPSAWLVLAATSTLAGNATILGAAANVIVAETARAFGEEFSVWRFIRVGFPIAIVTVIVAVLMLQAMG